jgi:ferrous iron transport protein B
VVAWTTGVAYITAGTFYQLATYSRHPQSSIAWSLGLATVLIATLIGLRLWARRGDNAEPAVEGAA